MESSTANEQVPAQPVAVQIAPEAPNREIKVFSPPANAPLPAEMPESFYKLDANDIGKLYKSQMDNRQKIENAPLRTQKMRTTEEQERMKKYPRATIRVRLPDGTILQAVFESKEKVSALYSFIRTTLETPDRQFLLCLPPRTKLVDPDLSLFKANLAPASNVMFVWIEKATGSEHVLRKEYLDMKQPLAVPSPVASQDTQQEKPTPPVKTSKVPKWLQKGLYKK